ncbi:MAG: 50S ribosomal protein L18 [Nanoarchaeota archaeon]
MRNKNKNRVFRFNRRIRGQTDYLLRLKLLRSKLTRIVVRKFNNSVIVQFVDYSVDGDKVLTSARSIDLKRLGFTLNRGNITSAYLTGYLAGKRAILAGLKSDCIVDLGLQNVFYGGKLFAAVKGVKDAGVNIKVKNVVFPSEERIKGKHLVSKDVDKIIEKTKKNIEGLKK